MDAGLNLAAVALLLCAAAAQAQPVPLGQSARTQIGWSGVTVAGVTPTQVRTAESAGGPADIALTTYGFNAIVLGQTSIFTGTAQASSTPIQGSNPGDVTGTRLSAYSSAVVSNSRVQGSVYSVSSTAFYSERFSLSGNPATAAFIDLTFSLNGSMQRSQALQNLISRLTVSVIPPGSSSSTVLYTDTLGQAPTLNGAPIAAANPNEVSRTVNQTLTYRIALNADGSPVPVAFSLNAFSSIGTGTLVGLYASAMSQFTAGLELQSIAVRDAAGQLVQPFSFTVVGATGQDYSKITLPTPGALGVLVLGGYVASRRRR